MDYFDTEDKYPEEGQQIDEVNKDIEIAPPPEELPSETIEIKNKSVLNYLIPRENKKWHFTLNDTNKEQLNKVLESIPGYNGLTVEYAVKKDDAGITLKINGEDIGKIHFLLCDRPNVNLREKYYCKLHFYKFKNQDLYNKVKTALVNFFENFKPMNSTTGGNRLKKRITLRKNKRMQRKKTNKRVAPLKNKIQ